MALGHHQINGDGPMKLTLATLALAALLTLAVVTVNACAVAVFGRGEA